MKSVIEETLAQAQANQRLFATRLVCLSKTGSKSPKVTDIRPIAVTTLPQKIIEHILLNKLELELELGNTINRSQFGFRSGKETLMHIVRLLDRIKSHKSQTLPRMQQCLIFIDFSSAFDGIDHQLLIDKIIHKGKCSKETLNLLKWYLNHINIRINEDMIMQNKGSPQEGRSSPILWILYIDDLLDELENMADLRNVFAFADDLMIYCRSLPLAYKVVRAILKWSQDNKIKVNTKKSAILPLAKTKRKTDKFDKSILNIPYVTTYKYLGITFDYTMKFRQTLENTTKIVRNMKNYKVLGKSNMSLTQRLQIWKTYFHSKTLYPLMVLSMINKTSADKITSQISMSFKNTLGLNKQLSKEVMYAGSMNYRLRKDLN